MQHLLYFALLSLSLTALACNPVVLPAADAGQGGEVGDGGGTGGTCDPSCGENASCNSDDTCECNAGFEGDGQTCADIDECAADNGGCDSNALCINTAGSRTCVCNPTFTGDGETCAEVWSRIGTLPDVDINPEQHGAIAAAAGTQIFFGPSASTPAQFMRSFDIDNAQFSGPHPLPPGASTDFCACGYTESFVSDGTSLFLLGNSGYRYRPDSQSWEIFAPYDTDSRRGEAGSAYDAVSNSIVLFGGRDNETNAIRFDIDAGAQVGVVEPGTIPVAMYRAVALGLPNMAVSFVANRDEQTDVVELFSHPTGTSEWNAKADAPLTMGQPRTMGRHGPELWIADSNGALFFYNRVDDSWNNVPVSTPDGTQVVLNAGEGEIIAIAQAGSAVQVYRLNELP